MSEGFKILIETHDGGKQVTAQFNIPENFDFEEFASFFTQLSAMHQRFLGIAHKLIEEQVRIKGTEQNFPSLKLEWDKFKQ
jgi:hypothetical protein